MCCFDERLVDFGQFNRTHTFYSWIHIHVAKLDSSTPNALLKEGPKISQKVSNDVMTLLTVLTLACLILMHKLSI